MDKNNSHLAGEFLVAGELSRRGLCVAITFGNAKSVDIFAQSAMKIYRVDAKAICSKSNWPITRASVRPDVVYVFVALGSESEIAKNAPPEYFIVDGSALMAGDLIRDWNGRSGIPYAALYASRYKDAWSAFA